MSTDSLVQRLERVPHTFLQPSKETPAGAISLTKEILDRLAGDVVQLQNARRDEIRRKRKRGNDNPRDEILRLQSLYTKNLAVQQVWEQARRILDAACDEVEGYLTRRPGTEDDKELIPSAQESAHIDSEVNGLDAVDNEFETDDEDLDNEEDDDDDTEMDGQDSVLDENEEEDIEEMDEDNTLDGDLSGDAEAEEEEMWTQDKHGLNDGFFSIDNFNRQSQFLEQMDARGDDDNPSDEDDVDWDADPSAQQITSTKSKQTHEEGDSGSDSDDEGEAGPTFGNADLKAPDSDDDLEQDDEDMDLDGGMPGLSNTNEIHYTDFFAPPPRQLSKTKRMRALPKTQPQARGPGKVTDDMEEEMQRAMNDVTRDIFASESENEEASDSDGSAPKANMSTHERQRAKVAAEIRRLEAASVAKRDWTLSGEARAAERPINSLIEEDLEFERVGKPVPVVTNETTEEIEQLIKRRILAREFDEVIRRHADSTGNTADTRRGRIELDDSKPQSGLAEVYEQEHLKATDPNYLDSRSKQTKKQHAEIDKLWKEVSQQLDLLSNLHFKPKRVEAEIKVVEDKPRIAMEDARPVGEGLGDESALAPQEVYKAGDRKAVGGEVLRKSGIATSKEEMSREEKRRKRQREKERAKKGKIGQGVEPAATTDAKSGKQKTKKKSKSEEKQGILEELKRGGVQVVGKKGELQDLAGKKSRGKSEVTSSALKL